MNEKLTSLNREIEGKIKRIENLFKAFMEPGVKWIAFSIKSEIKSNGMPEKRYI